MAWLTAAALAVVPMPRGVRYRFRLAAPVAAGRADRIAAAALPLIGAVILALLIAAVWPGQQPSLRLWSVGAAIGVATGLPSVVERRDLRRRLVALAPLPDPAASLPPDGDGAEVPLEAATDPDALRLGALRSARSGRARDAGLRALRAVQLDPSRADVLLDTGAALCRRGRFGEGVRLLERGVEVSRRSRSALRLLAAGAASAGRLREAVAALDEAEGISGRR